MTVCKNGEGNRRKGLETRQSHSIKSFISKNTDSILLSVGISADTGVQSQQAAHTAGQEGRVV